MAGVFFDNRVSRVSFHHPLNPAEQPHLHSGVADRSPDDDSAQREFPFPSAYPTPFIPRTYPATPATISASQAMTPRSKVAWNPLGEFE